MQSADPPTIEERVNDVANDGRIRGYLSGHPIGLSNDIIRDVVTAQEETGGRAATLLGWNLFSRSEVVRKAKSAMVRFNDIAHDRRLAMYRDGPQRIHAFDQIVLDVLRAYSYSGAQGDYRTRLDWAWKRALAVESARKRLQEWPAAMRQRFEDAVTALMRLQRSLPQLQRAVREQVWEPGTTLYHKISERTEV